MSSNWKEINIFFGLSVLFLALVPLLSLVTGASMDFDAAAASATLQIGIEQTSNLITVGRLSLVEPSLWLLVLGSSVPALAAIATCFFTDRSLLPRLFSRFKPVGQGVGMKSALFAYGSIFILIPACLFIAYFLRSLFPGQVEYSQPENLFGLTLITALLAAAFLDQGGVLEELGWRGFAQAKLQGDLMSPLKASLVIGLFWGLWHVPQHIFSGVIARLGIFDYVLLLLPAFTMGTIAVSIIVTFFMNRVGGSVIPAIMIHGLANDASGLAGVANLNVALTPYHQLSKYLPFLLLALVLIVVYGRELGRNPQCQ